ncbi:MAG TPA: formylmethanofuran dehydrogenase subunit A [Methylomirabilota bacterium]|jgi:formylmethanofuran dehydrogenase subunit A|nr:formylmethanofuran dehydrogenase subunit A [Methylomirabilota bacterium]
MLRVVNGRVYDPANGVDGEVRTLAIRDGRIVAEAELGRNAPTLDARGLLVLPGGVDLHSHIAGPKVNAARKLRPEDHRRAPPVPRTPTTRSGVMGSTPSTFATGYSYARLGYTTVFDAAVPPLGARHAHEELHDTPVIDKGFFVLMGNNEYVLRCLGKGEREKLRHFVAWLLGAAKGYAVKLVNPGGVEVWKQGGGNVKGLDDVVAPHGVTPRQIIVGLTQAVAELGIPHPAHVHANNLGIAGNWATTLETMRAIEGRRAHFAHVQFHSYGGEPGAQPSSRVRELIDYVDGHPNISVDVGQVVFGDTTSMTGDGPLGYFLHNVTGHKWFNGDVEMEEGCGIVPIRYKPGSRVHATQWAIGLEWLLLAKDPWRVVLSTDHPNGGSFLAYPQIVRLLMDREYRKQTMRAVNSKALAKTTLPELDREYSLSEVVIVTRAAPARLLGLSRKGHLGVGADADVAILSPGPDWQQVFEAPRYVIKDGAVLVDDGEVRGDHEGRTYHVEPPWDPAILPELRKWFADFYTIEFENYPVDPEYLARPERIATVTG